MIESMGVFVLYLFYGVNSCHRPIPVIAIPAVAAQKRAMLWLAAVLVVMPPAAVEASPGSSGRYGMLAGYEDGKCYYLLGDDVELNAHQLSRELRSGYDTSLGIDVVRDSDVRPNCMERANRILRRAGFTRITVRAASPDDWFGPRPPGS